VDLVRAYQIKKYDEIIVEDSLIKDKLKANSIPNLYNVGVDFSLDANIFYGVKEGDNQYESVNAQDFDKYDIVFRLLNWVINIQREDYAFRVLKSNRDEKVDFEEEKEYLKCRVF
jgi:hypothetical protein